MARDYVGDIQKEEGAYVCIPMETLEKVSVLLDSALEWSLGVAEERLTELKQELFPEEGSSTTKGGK